MPDKTRRVQLLMLLALSQHPEEDEDDGAFAPSVPEGSEQRAERLKRRQELREYLTARHSMKKKLAGRKF